MLISELSSSSDDPNASNQAKAILSGEKTEWTYKQRRDMQLIVPGLYLGPLQAATKANFENLLQHKISHIVCVRENKEKRFVRPNFPQNFKYLTVEVEDKPYENIMSHFGVVNSFLNDAIDNGGVALVHGNAGISRSATLVIAYVMQKFELTSHDAFICVRDRRFCINPNVGFRHQLKEYEPIYLAERDFQDRPSSESEDCGVKRKLTEDGMDATTIMT
uniref:Serine/threonine/tyrosine-interacting protein-like n=1 Tax=Ciona intestinalis TaxID=7719 RepID=F6TVM0_CIOIN|nr:serine/threonine/tyrosine-interacting protein-like [Ciona intestinalis]|eukprot:XP_026693732.1 serine/threonine/tyrosine-interacting protein-like [Ciona intestinalis]